MQLTYKCKIVNHKEALPVLDFLGLTASKLYNCALWEVKQHYELTGKHLGAYDLRNLLRRTENVHFKNLYSNCAEETVFEVSRAYKSFFALHKQDPLAQPPHFKKKDTVTAFAHSAHCGFKFLPDNQLRISLANPVKDVFQIPYLYLTLQGKPDLDFKAVRAIRFVKIKDTWQLHCITEVGVPELKADGVTCAIDLGIINFATLAMSDGYTAIYSGREFLSQLRYYSKEIAKTKPRNWKPGSKNTGLSQAAKRLYKHAADKRTQFIHCLTKQIVAVCVAHGVNEIVLGDLTHIRKGKDYGKKTNQKLHSWPFLQFVEKLTYKAALQGIVVKQISEAYTSQTCCQCGIRDKSNRKHRGLYTCACGNTINADLNGAINILQKHLGNHLDNFNKPAIIHYRPFETAPLQVV